MYSNGSKVKIETAECKRCGGTFHAGGLRAAFGWCKKCYEKECLECPFFCIEGRFMFIENIKRTQKRFFYPNITYNRTEFSDKMILFFTAAFYKHRENGKTILLKSYHPIREPLEVKEDGNSSK